jgi:methionyl-tRNA synthetase
MSEFKRYLITSALPYANGPVHIGHLAGVYVPADIYVRYLRMCGRDVFFVGGSDEHGVPITIQARKQNCSPQDIVWWTTEQRTLSGTIVRLWIRMRMAH